MIDMFKSSDQELAILVKRGEDAAFGELVRRYQTSVFNVCYRLIGERQEAEDLTQESFIRAHQRFDLYHHNMPIGPWIRKLATNLCLNWLKRAQITSFALEDEHDEPVAGSENPEDVRLKVEREEVVRQALLSLPPHYRSVIELRHFQDLSYNAISEVLEIPLSDVKSHLFRARQILAKRLEPYVRSRSY